MKSNIKYYTAIVGAILFIGQINATEGIPTDEKNAMANAIKVKELTLKKEKLQNKIAVEDKNRNRHIDDVAPEALEKINERQDSLCLALRSELVSVELELKELTPNKISSTVADQYNTLVQQNKIEN